MNDEQLNFLLEEVGTGSRTAFRALFDGAGPLLCRHLAQFGVPQGQARQTFIDVFGSVWEDADQYDMGANLSAGDWILRLANLKQQPQSAPCEPVVIDEKLWDAVAQRAYPDSWRNMVKSLGIGSAVVCAVSWALILLGIRYFQ